MFARIAPTHPGRVLAVVSAPQFPGQAVVDCQGLAPGSFATWKLRPSDTSEVQRRSFNHHLLHSLRLYRPDSVVLGVPWRDDLRSRILREKLHHLAVLLGVPVIERSVAEARHLLLGCRRGSTDDTMAAHLAEGFFPELGQFRSDKQTMPRRYRSHAFDAVALAILALVERAPLSAAAIAKDAAFAMGTFNAALMASARRHFPDSL